MRRTALLASFLAAAAAPAPERVIAPGTPITWSADQYQQPVRFRIGPISLLVAPVREKIGVGPRVTVSESGRSSVTIDGETVGEHSPATIRADRWNRAGDFYVLLDSYEGGAHCCDHLQLAIPQAHGFRNVDLGSYDGGGLRQSPKDLDGDGRIEFVVEDDSFLYQFGSYADSFAPPKILNVVGERVIDVSRKRAFRPIFLRAMQQARRGCLHVRASTVNGDCAGYAAAAARAGLFDHAWPEVLRAYDRKDELYPHGCRLAGDGGDCPPPKNLYRSYPESLRAFLRSHGYIAH